MAVQRSSNSPPKTTAAPAATPKVVEQKTAAEPKKAAESKAKPVAQPKADSYAKADSTPKATAQKAQPAPKKQEKEGFLAGLKDMVKGAFEGVKAESKPAAAASAPTHEVKKGETLSKILKDANPGMAKGDLDKLVKETAQLNGMKDANKLSVGQKLQLPGAKAEAKSAPAAPKEAAAKPKSAEPKAAAKPQDAKAAAKPQDAKAAAKPQDAKAAAPASEKAKTQDAKATSTSGTPKSKSTFTTTYTPSDLKKLTGEEYKPVDKWVNVVANKEGRFTDSKDLKDDGGLSVGLKQWTQNSGRLGDLMQRYKDVASRDGKLDTFNETFGGKEKADKLLADLKKNPKSISSDSIKDMFANAGKMDLFKKAQIEQARAEVPGEMQGIAKNHPYVKDGSVSEQSMALAVAANNIGPNYVGRMYKEAVNGLYDQLKAKNPEIAKGQKETDDFKRQMVVQNVSEKDFNQHLITSAPKALYKTPAKYEKYHAGVEQRLRENLDFVSADNSIDPSKL